MAVRVIGAIAYAYIYAYITAIYAYIVKTYVYIVRIYAYVVLYTR